jgi:O-antigen ligase
VYLAFLPFIIKNRENILRACKPVFLAWILVSIALISTGWSQVPEETFKHSVLLFVTTVFGMYFGTRFEPGEQLRVLAVVLGISIVLSFMLALVLPAYGVQQWEYVGAWRGIYPHKNALAHTMALAAVVYLMQLRLRGMRIGAMLGLIGAAVLILMSQSVTGLLVFGLIVIFLKGSFLLRWEKSRLLMATIVAIPAALFVVRRLLENWTTYMQMLGRTSTLSGRVYLWVLAGIMGIRHPWLGYGYNGFWLGPRGPSAHIWRALNWPAMNGHNGFLDLWLSLGLLGLSIFLVLFGIVFWRALKLARSFESPLALWPLAYLLFLFVYNLDESNLFQHNNLFWVLFIAVCASLGQPHWATLRLQSPNQQALA